MIVWKYDRAKGFPRVWGFYKDMGGSLIVCGSMTEASAKKDIARMFRRGICQFRIKK